MSAFVVPKSHINAMLLSVMDKRFTWYHDGHKELNELTANRVGQMLLDENVKSVCCRYNDSEITDLPGRINAEWLIPFEFHYVHRVPKPLEAISIVRCYAYQSCEHPEWEASEAKAFCDALIACKIAELPGYDDAPWEWDDPEYESPALQRLV